MLKYAKIIDEKTKEVSIATGINTVFYQSIGMSEMDVEQAWDGAWYIAGYIPEEPEKILSYAEKRALEYPDVKEQLDMIYWDKVNGSDNWLQCISEIKNKYPKPEEKGEEE